MGIYKQKLFHENLNVFLWKITICPPYEGVWLYSITSRGSWRDSDWPGSQSDVSNHATTCAKKVQQVATKVDHHFQNLCS